MSAKRNRAVAVAAYIAIGGWLILIGGYMWWTLQPVTLPAVTEPIPILNKDKQIPIGDPIIMTLEVDKPVSARAISSVRFIACDSGNLVTLTSTARDLPTGTYTIISDNVTLPAKVNPGDHCVFTFRISYEINPIRTEVVDWESERFEVLPAP